MVKPSSSAPVTGHRSWLDEPVVRHAQSIQVDPVDRLPASWVRQNARLDDRSQQ